MKKVLFVMVLIIAVLVVNAQTTATTTQAKPTTTVIKVADLPKAITDNVSKDYPGFTIKDATSTNTNDVLTYDVVIVKGTATHTLVYDKDGKFLKNEANDSREKITDIAGIQLALLIIPPSKTFSSWRD